MKRLKIILQSKYFYFILILTTLIFVIFNNYIIKRQSIYYDNSNSVTGIIDDYHIDGDYLSINLKSKENINATYYFKTEKEKNNFALNYKLGDKVKLIGELSSPINNTNFNLFNYKEYLYNNNIFYTMTLSEIKKEKSNKSILYNIKNSTLSRIDKLSKSNNYVKAFVLGDNKDIDLSIRQIYQNLGISHLFAVSGMHVTFLTGVVVFILKKFKLKEIKIYILVSLFLYLYVFLTGFSGSVLRASLFFILLSFNKVFKLNISIIKVLIITLLLIILFNPLIIYDVGFLFSSVISSYLIVFSSLIANKKGYIKKLIYTSFIALLTSIPISLYNFFSFNYLSIIYNLLFVPLISIIIFPLSIITFIFPMLDNILYLCIDVLEKLSIFLNNIDSNISFIKPSILICFIYYIFITISLIFIKRNNRIPLILFILILIIHYNFNSIYEDKYVLTIDVNQGDSILIHSNNKNVLIDTGGKVSIKKEEKWQKRKNTYNITNSTLIPLFKSLGIKKIDYLILSHGDYDHMGEAINLVNNFKVEKVILNCGPYNDLESELIKVLDKKKIKYYSCIKELNINNNKLYFLHTKKYDNENDNSNVIYTELNGYKFIFMGDASSTTEKEIMSIYNLPDIDVLKVGHHGSKTSSGKDFINEINPKYSIISVGKNNRYGHPNKEVLETLSESKIYRTDQDGSIMIKIKNNKLNIETCSP